MVSITERINTMMDIRSRVRIELNVPSHLATSPELEIATAIYVQTIAQAVFADEICADIDRLEKQ